MRDATGDDTSSSQVYRLFPAGEEQTAPVSAAELLPDAPEELKEPSSAADADLDEQLDEYGSCSY